MKMIPNPYLGRYIIVMTAKSDFVRRKLSGGKGINRNFRKS